MTKKDIEKILDYSISKVFKYEGYCVQFCLGSWLLYDADGNHIQDFGKFTKVLEYIETHQAEQEDRK